VVLDPMAAGCTADGSVDSVTYFYVILGFCRGVNEISALLGCYAE